MSPSPLKQIMLECFTVFLFLMAVSFQVQAFSIRDIVRGDKRLDKGVQCPSWHPFACPSGDCIPFKYICDGSADCSDNYDEDVSLCTAAARPPVEETSQFLSALLNAHGSEFFVPLFGHNARNALNDLGGIDRVSVAISQAPTIEAFGTDLKMTDEEVKNLRKILEAIVIGQPSTLDENESADFRFFAQKLKETGFF